VLRAWSFDAVAVLVFDWHEPMDPPERGARIEVRLLADEATRGTRYAAQRVVIDQPVFRADLFDQVDAPPGNLRSAHFHPQFDGVEPCDRTWVDDVRNDPTGWLAAQLSDLEQLFEKSASDPADVATLRTDAEALRAVIPEIVAAVEATWAAVRSEPLSGELSPLQGR
jgi:hypothetical protein